MREKEGQEGQEGPHALALSVDHHRDLSHGAVIVSGAESLVLLKRLLVKVQHVIPVPKKCDFRFFNDVVHKT